MVKNTIPHAEDVKAIIDKHESTVAVELYPKVDAALAKALSEGNLNGEVLVEFGCVVSNETQSRLISFFRKQLDNLGYVVYSFEILRTGRSGTYQIAYYLGCD